MPIFTPDAVWGLTIGCFFSNMLSFSPVDMLFGTLATLVSAICTARLAHIRFKGLPFAACLPPVILNAIIIGSEITFLFMPEAASISVLLLNMLTVGAGQVISCIVLGLPLFKIVEKTKVLNEFFSN